MLARPCQPGLLSTSFPPRRLLHNTSRILHNSSRILHNSSRILHNSSRLVHHTPHLRPTYPAFRYPSSTQRGISLTAADLAPPRPSRFRNWRKWVCRGSVLICIVGGYMGYVGLQVLGDQDQANYLLCYLIHTQRVVHSPLYTEHLSRFSSSSSPYPPISASESIPASESTPAASSQLNSDTTLDKTSLLLFRTLIHHWLEVPPSQITTYFSALSALPPSAGVGPIVRSSLVAIKAHLAKADERDLGLASSRRSKGMGMGGGVLGGGKKLGTVKDRDESVDVMENQEDLIKLISEVADLTNEALGKLNALLEGEEDECECENGKGKGMQLELGLEYEEGGEGKKGSGNGGKVPKRRERKEYEDVE